MRISEPCEGLASIHGELKISKASYFHVLTTSIGSSLMDQLTRVQSFYQLDLTNTLIVVSRKLDKRR